MSGLPNLRVTGFDGPALGDPNGHYWAKLSTEILADPEVSDAEKIALAGVQTLARGGATTATNDEIGRACGKDGETVARLLRRLEGRGLVSRETLGRVRTVRLNFGFRGPTGQGGNPGTSAGANNCPTPAPLPTNPGASDGGPRQKCRPTPADAPPTLRLAQRAKDPALDRGPAPARVEQAPPSPSPEGTGETDRCSLIECPSEAPKCPDLDESTRRRIPPNGSIFRPWQVPIGPDDLLSDEQRAWRLEILATADPTGRAYAEAWIAAKRHNAALWLGQAQQNARPQALESERSGAPEIAVEPACQSLPGPDRLSTPHVIDHNGHYIT